MRILITGAAGFIGTHLAGRWAESGIPLVLLDRSNAPEIESLRRRGTPFLKEDIRNWKNLLNELVGVTHIVHLAATVSILQCETQPETSYENNIMATQAALELARTIKANFIFASSAAVYGNCASQSTEDMKLAPANLYGLAKWQGEQLCELYGKRYGVPWAAFRMFNVYGSASSRSSIYASVIPAFIQAALVGGALTIYGDGEQRRDFVYIGDLPDMYLQLINQIEKLGNRILNLGTGRSVSVKELAALILSLTNSKSEVLYESARPNEIKLSQADTELCIRELGMAATTPLEAGLAKVLSNE
jgi:UDP-glucose 4-epimerase